jgi:hypothetical protein
MKMKWYSIFGILTLTICLSGTAAAQETTGSIVGTVKDSLGAAVAGATVTIADSTKKDVVVRTVTTNDDGEFVAPNMAVGIYIVTVEAANFKKSVNTDIKLDVGQRRAVPITLQAGNISETVTVEADPVAVDVSSAESGTLINGDQIRELAVNTRNFVGLVTLAPGVTYDPEGNDNV